MQQEKLTEIGFNRLQMGPLAEVKLLVDDTPLMVRVGDTILTALNVGLGHIRNFEFHSELRTGFCFMGACQDCWLWTSSGDRIRACTTFVEPGMSLSTTAPEARS